MLFILTVITSISICVLLLSLGEVQHSKAFFSIFLYSDRVVLGNRNYNTMKYSASLSDFNLVS